MSVYKFNLIPLALGMMVSLIGICVYNVRAHQGSVEKEVSPVYLPENRSVADYSDRRAAFRDYMDADKSLKAEAEKGSP